MVLTYDAYVETKDLQAKTQEQMKSMQNQLETVKFMLEKLFIIGVTGEPKTASLIAQAYNDYSQVMDLRVKEEPFSFLKDTVAITLKPKPNPKQH